jgi:D-alanyl-D-alanine carboxypeptidase/D-alanyl-D-alanine-endopeptidase (penicillin-binding protein 4)
MSRRVLAVLVLGLLVPTARADDESQLASRLDAALRARALRGSQTAALVVSRRDDEVIYARDPGRLLVPASNQKVLTALAVLAAFGPTHRFTTEIFAESAPDAEGGVPFLAIRGGGDPSLTSEDAWRLAANLRRLGLRRVRGDLLLDDSAFDAERWHPNWGPVSARAYHAPVGALMMNYGAFAAAVTPGRRHGDPVAVFLDPPVDFLRLSNRAVTGPARSRRSLVVDRSAGADGQIVTVSGSLPVGSEPRVVHRSVIDPARYAGAVIRMQLEAVGIAVDGVTRSGPVPEGAVLLHAFEGKPVSEIVRLFVKYSNNAIAESLVKALGVQAGAEVGSWRSGMRALRERLQELGLDTSELRLVDGSGLSYDNRLTPRALVDALRIADRSFRFGPELAAALPIAAADGTLEKRAEDAAAAVRAKTGLLTRVTGLSGYARLGDGRDVVFSVLSNGYRSDAERAMNALDGFLEALVGGPASAQARSTSPPS